MKIQNSIIDLIFEDIRIQNQSLEFDSFTQNRFQIIQQQSDWQRGNLILAQDTSTKDQSAYEDFLKVHRRINVQPFDHDVMALNNADFQNPFIQ